jgi:hypothetical protein
MEINTNSLNRQATYRQSDYSGSPMTVEHEIVDRINLSVRVPLPEINRRRVLKIVKRVLVNLAITVLSLVILYKALWFMTHLTS